MLRLLGGWPAAVDQHWWLFECYWCACPTPNLPSKSAWPSTCPKIYPLRGQNGMAPLGAGDFFEGEAREKKGGWRVQMVRVGTLIQQPLSRSTSASGKLWPEACTRCMCVCGSHALFTHSQIPSLVAWQEERDAARRAALKKTAAP